MFINRKPNNLNLKLSNMIPLAVTKGHQPTVMHIPRCWTRVRLPRRLCFCCHQLSLRTNMSPPVVEMKTPRQSGLLLTTTYAFKVSGDQISAGLVLYRRHCHCMSSHRLSTQAYRLIHYHSMPHTYTSDCYGYHQHVIGRTSLFIVSAVLAAAY
jgi:hypothetical protein